MMQTKGRSAANREGGVTMEREGNSSYLQTAGRALSVLQLFEDKGEYSLTEISHLIHLGPTITYRLLYTLTEHCFLSQDPVSKRYRIGDGTVMLGLVGLQNKEIYRASHRLVLDYYQQTGDHVCVTVCIGGKSVVIEKFSSLADDEDSLYIGQSYSLQRGASNRILLAFMDARQQEEYLESLLLDDAQRAGLQEELNRIRQRGYDYTEQLLTKGLWGLSVPIYDRYGRFAAGLSTGDFLDENSALVVPERLERLRQLADRIMKRMRN